jgi:hypothetical protein
MADRYQMSQKGLACGKENSGSAILTHSQIIKKARAK